jgi:hypothetical protein
VGQGYTVEGQKTGEEKFGALQIEVIPDFEEDLRYWTRAPREATEPRQPDLAGLILPMLNDQRTPFELSLRSGDKLRSYPRNPIQTVPLTISDLVPPSTHIHLKVG